MEKPQCPVCGLSSVEANGEYIPYNGYGYDGYYYGWWECQYCGHEWRYEDPALNPD